MENEKKDYSKYRNIKIEDLPITWFKGKDNFRDMDEAYLYADVYYKMKKSNIYTLEDLFIYFEKKGFHSDNNARTFHVPTRELELLLYNYEDIKLSKSFKSLLNPVKDYFGLFSKFGYHGPCEQFGLGWAEHSLLREYYDTYKEYIISTYGENINFMNLIEIFLHDKNYLNSISNLSASDVYSWVNGSSLKINVVIKNLEFKAELYKKYLKSNKLYEKISFSESKKNKKDLDTKIDYSKYREISIKDSLPISLYGNEKVLMDMGINTLEDLFVAYENGSFIGFKKELQGEIEWLFSYYTGAPLLGDKILFQDINLSNFINRKEILNDYKSKSKIFKIGIDEYELYELYRYCRKRIEYIKYEVNSENVSLMTLINIYINDIEYHMNYMMLSNDKNISVYGAYLSNLQIKYNLYIKSLNFKKSSNDVVDSVTIKEYKKHIDFLLKRRELLDAHIALLENKLSKIERTGELRR